MLSHELPLAPPPVNDLRPAPKAPASRPSPEVTRLYRTYAPQVTRWASRLVRSTVEAEDVTHEVFLVVHRRLDELSSIENPSSWLYAITVNIARHRWRDQRKAALTRARWSAEAAPATASPFDEIERRSLLGRVARVLESLPPRQRRLLVLGDVRCLPTSRLSAMTGINPQTLRVRRFRARNLMAKRLRELERTSEAARAAR